MTGLTGEVFLVCEDKPGHLSPVCCTEHGSPSAEANARLIAATPALYEALALLVADVADYPAWQRPCHALDVARAALALATGASQ